MTSDFVSFVKLNSDTKILVLFGEIHGTKEVPALLTNLFSEMIKTESFNVCFEFSSNFQKKFNSFFNTGDISLIEKLFEDNSDGRLSDHYLTLMRKIYDLNSNSKNSISVFCVDVADNFSSENFQNDREEIIAKNILQINSQKTFAILGNIHASIKPLDSLNGIMPTGFYLKEELNDSCVSIQLVPKSLDINPFKPYSELFFVYK